MQASTFKRTLVALAVAGAFAAGAGVADRVGVKAAHAAVTAASPAAAALASGAPTALPDFADLVAKHGPAVVQISVSQNREKVAARGGRGKPDLENMFPDLPGFRNFPHREAPDDTPMQGMARASSPAPTASSSPTPMSSPTPTRSRCA